jgi:hypothetical protein
LGAAIGSEVPTARGGVQRAVQEDVLDSLYQPATGAGNLFWGVMGVEPLGILPNKGMACSDAVKGGIGNMGELNFGGLRDV